MAGRQSPSEFIHSVPGRFHTTCWSIVLAAGRGESPGTSARALETLCQTYWLPVYRYFCRRVANTHDAQDLAQSFFAELLSRQAIQTADPGRGRFRTFLLTACQRFLSNYYRNLHRIKRGGQVATLSLNFESAENELQIEAVDEETAERIFEHEWALALLQAVLDLLRDEYCAKGKLDLFEMLKLTVTDVQCCRYAEIAEQLGMQENAVKVAAHRLKLRFRELLRSEIAQTVQRAEEVEDEIRRLFSAVSMNS
ncbi:MAG: sigma-70 family RNA polymerase sigma factor [Planctomycetaceae bacterium]